VLRDVKYLPQMADETRRRYLFVAIDRATRWVTDNGKEFTDRLLYRDKQASGQHEFDQLCAALTIEHRLTRPRTPQTNGMVERFNGRIADILKTHHFMSGEDLNKPCSAIACSTANTCPRRPQRPPLGRHEHVVRFSPSNIPLSAGIESSGMRHLRNTKT
jgi:transposase InsO family protein